MSNEQMTESRFGSLLQQIDEICVLDEALKMIKQVDALKSVLESIGTFRDQSVKYAKLQAESLIRAVELGGEKKLRGNNHDIAVWLFELSPAEREKYISMCEEGLLIEQVYKREVVYPRQLEKQTEVLVEYRDQMVCELEEAGYVDLTDMSRMMESIRFPIDLRADFLDGTRNALRRSGGLGVGFKSGIYVTSDVGNDEQLKSAISTRCESILLDLRRLRDICKKSKVMISPEYFPDPICRNDEVYIQFWGLLENLHLWECEKKSMEV